MAARVGSDKWLFFTTLLLIVVGLAMVFSASAVVAQERYHSEFAYVGRQAGWALAGAMAMLVLMNIDTSFYNSPKVIFPLLAMTTLLLVMVFLFPDSHNTHRWIRFGGLFTFQPSEIAKPVMVLFLAWFLSTRLEAMRKWKQTILPAIVMPLVFMGLIGRQPDLGTALVLFGVTVVMLWLAGIDWKWLVGGVAAALPVVGAMLFFVAWRRARVFAFLDPPCSAKDASAAGYHICQSLIAVGTGGMTGRGYMESMQKLFYLPEASTDFIFSIIGEELGFIGAFLIVLLFAFLGMRGFRAAFRTKDPFARLIAFGITTTILLQAFFNISVVLSLVPTKGIPLPLISSGGTSLFCTLASIGVLLNISRKEDRV